MFQGWATADELSLAALGIAASALVISALSARFSAIQAGVARRKEKADREAQAPILESRIEERLAGDRADMHRIAILVINRLDEPIICESLRIVAPRRAKLIRSHQVAGYMIETGLPEIEAAAQQITFNRRVAARDDRSAFPTHLDVLVLIPPARSATSSESLTMSLSVRRANASVSFIEIMVVTKMPPVATNTDA